MKKAVSGQVEALNKSLAQIARQVQRTGTIGEQEENTTKNIKCDLHKMTTTAIVISLSLSLSHSYN